MELEGRFASLCAVAQGDVRRSFPTFGLALATFKEAHWSALAGGGPLRQWKLIELEASEPLTTTVLRIDEPILHFLTGIEGIDERLRGLFVPAPFSHHLSPPHTALP